MEASRWQTSMWGIGVQDRKRDLTPQTSSQWKKLYLNESWSTNMEEPPSNFLWFLGAFAGVGGCCSLCSVPRGRHCSRAQPTFRTGKHTTHQPHSHPFTTERFPIPRRWVAPFISNQSSISVQQKVWDIIVECDVIRADPEVYALTTLSFFSFETEIYDRRQRERQRSQGWWNALRKHRAGTKGYMLLTALCSKADQERKAAQLPLVYKFTPFLDFSLDTQDAAAVVSLAEPSAESRAWLPEREASAQLTGATSPCAHWPRLGRWHGSDRMPSQSRDASLQNQKPVQDPKPGSDHSEPQRQWLRPWPLQKVCWILHT